MKIVFLLTRKQFRNIDYRTFLTNLMKGPYQLNNLQVDSVVWSDLIWPRIHQQKIRQFKSLLWQIDRWEAFICSDWKPQSQRTKKFHWSHITFFILWFHSTLFWLKYHINQDYLTHKLEFSKLTMEKQRWISLYFMQHDLYNY